MNDKKSVLREYVEAIDWNQPLEDLQKSIIEHFSATCTNAHSKQKLNYIVSQLGDVAKLQAYAFNALLKFEGHGVIGVLPR